MISTAARPADRIRRRRQHHVALPRQPPRRCIGDRHRHAVRQDVADARTLGIRGTLGVVLDGVATTIPPNVEELRSLLDAALGE